MLLIIGCIQSGRGPRACSTRHLLTVTKTILVIMELSGLINHLEPLVLVVLVVRGLLHVERVEDGPHAEVKSSSTTLAFSINWAKVKSIAMVLSLTVAPSSTSLCPFTTICTISWPTEFGLAPISLWLPLSRPPSRYPRLTPLLRELSPVSPPPSPGPPGLPPPSPGSPPPPTPETFRRSSILDNSTSSSRSFSFTLLKRVQMNGAPKSAKAIIDVERLMNFKTKDLTVPRRALEFSSISAIIFNYPYFPLFGLFIGLCQSSEINRPLLISSHGRQMTDKYEQQMTQSWTVRYDPSQLCSHGRQMNQPCALVVMYDLPMPCSHGRQMSGSYVTPTFTPTPWRPAGASLLPLSRLLRLPLPPTRARALPLPSSRVPYPPLYLLVDLHPRPFPHDDDHHPSQVNVKHALRMKRLIGFVVFYLIAFCLLHVICHLPCM